MVNALLQGNPASLCIDLNDDGVENNQDVPFMLDAILHPLAVNAHYVSPNGSDSNDGSVDRPWQTILHAVQNTEPGDTVYLRAGIYNEGEVWIRGSYGHGGSPGKYWTVTAYPGEEVVLSNAARPIIIDASYVRIIGLKFVDKAISVPDQYCDHEHVELINNTFSGVYGYGAIVFRGNHGLIEGNIINIEYNTDGTQGHGIYLMRGTGTIIRGNSISGPSGYGIHIYDEHKSEDTAGYIPVISDVVVENNVVTNSRERSGIIVAADYTTQIRGVIIRNNVLANNNQGNGIYATVSNGQVEDIFILNNTIFTTGTGRYRGGIAVNQNVKNVVIKNNIIYVSDQSEYHIMNYGEIQNVIADNNLYWPAPLKLVNVNDNHAIIADPTFVNLQNSDFHLQASSPAIDAGLALTEVMADKDNSSRPQGAGYDIGAYEYAGE